MSIELPRRPATPLSTTPHPVTDIEIVPKPAADAPESEPKARQMRVGRGLKLSGKITGCDRLVVEGDVEATLLECSAMELGASGVFKGTATVTSAEISGRFEGSLTVRERLFIRESGWVSGEIRYGQLQVECGGQLSGDIAAPAAAGEPRVLRPSR
jgi:cytoskeletal protein CcmA (bactofilin family)